MSLVRFATVLLVLAIAAVGAAQNTPTCTVNTDNVTPSCSTGDGWLSGVTCLHRTTSCTTVNGVSLADLGITFGYKTPPIPVLGTIVFFSHSGGITPDSYPGGERSYAGDYYAANFQVVQTQWDADWEDTETGTKNIAYAAGRPAAFLGWVNTNLYTPIHTAKPTAGMCVQGTSAGGAAFIYDLAWYGAGASIGGYLDHGVLLSSPPLSDVEEGCEVTGTNLTVTICPPGMPPTFGCNPANNPASWTASPYYTDALSGVRSWTQANKAITNYTCRFPGGNTATAANQAWKAMSIVDGNIAVFTYPKTDLTAWLCSRVYSNDNLCDGTMNNSSSQSQLFWQNFTSTSQLFNGGLLINGVNACNGDEDVSNAHPPQWPAIEAEMEAKCVSHHQ